ncbi:pectate lyase [Longimicrobium terrae]|uniref:PelA/Pel-15E family pectate lyase n=1 Tax=Longimicrobium terrae TaxID=1639882 RepID=A0A841GV51_9BACT|nr:pectate lyase [Longimicrobium terrae]MBB4634007.1 PelA/Pel-15E family pectate lyase [Longimicrobium terrae]MBB6069103.1 PelA/Pel-15E family pectate lyase [Longimicrobium terrae]NNC28277.1 pectate lyase [Longimicrobium terrae]
MNRSLFALRRARMAAPLLCSASVLLGACAPAQAAPADKPASVAATSAPAPAARAAQDTLLAMSRIVSLPAAERAAWTRYVQTSAENRRRDRAFIDAELRAAGKDAFTPAPQGNGFSVRSAMNEAWFRTDEARRLADILVSYQTPTGGWSKRTDYVHARQPGESFGSDDRWTWIGTLDNGSTTEQLNFLARANAAHNVAAYRDAFARGIEYLLVSQQPSGCWPQIYPLEGGYHDAATYNDDATVHALQVLRATATGEHAFVPAELRARAAAGVERGVGCILATQVAVNGRKTVWGAQHDPISLVPVKARAYEHASLTGRESAAILDFLLGVQNPSPQVTAAIHAAAAWFRESAITGYAYVPRGNLTPQAGAGPIWARFYEIGTNRPIFSDRDGVIRYNLSEIGDERRTGYLWYTDEPATSLRRYERWMQRQTAGNRE